MNGKIDNHQFNGALLHIPSVDVNHNNAILSFSAPLNSLCYSPRTSISLIIDARWRHHAIIESPVRMWGQNFAIIYLW
jgi:hypothetical protein